jgi:hypothetical protein
VHADENRQSAAEINAQIGTVNVQQQTQTTEHSSLAQHVPEQVQQQATAPHPRAPLLRPQPEDAHLSSHDVHLPPTTAYAVANAPPPHITPAIRMGGGGGRISPVLQYSMLKSNMALRVLYFLSSDFLDLMLVGHSGDGGVGQYCLRILFFTVLE